MAATPTVRHLDTASSVQTLASPSLTPAADSLWIIVATASEPTDTYVFDWGISGGAESYEAWDGSGGTTDLELADSFATGFGDNTWSQLVWVQQFGASPAARVVTVDPDADGTDLMSGIGLIIIEVTGHDTGDPIAQAVAGHTQDPPLSGLLSHTTSFGSAPSGSQIYVAVAECNPAATFDTPPTGWSQSDVDEGTVPYSLEVGESTTNTATGVTVATDSGATYHLGVTLFEFNDAPPQVSYVSSESNAEFTNVDAVTTTTPSGTSGDVLVAFGANYNDVGPPKRDGSAAHLADLTTLGEVGIIDGGEEAQIEVYTRVTDGTEDASYTLEIPVGETDGYALFHTIVRVEASQLQASSGGIYTYTSNSLHAVPAFDVDTDGSIAVLAMLGYYSGVADPADWTAREAEDNTFWRIFTREVDAGSFAQVDGVADTGVTASVLVVLGPAGLAAGQQEGYRWGTDDGSESAHGWEAAQDTDPAGLPTETTTLLRVLVDETGSGDLTDGYKLQYKRDDESPTEWRDVE